MTTATHNKIVEIVRTAGKLAEAGKPDSKMFAELMAWLNDCLDRDAEEDLAHLVELVRNSADPAADRYLTRTMRMIGGSQGIISDDNVNEELQLVALPLFLHPRQAEDASATLTHLECRAELERSLEAALGLPFASLRFADFPVSAIDLEDLDVVQTRRIAIDLVQQGDSPYLTPAVIDVGGSPEASHHQSLLWPAVLRVRSDERDENLARIASAMRQTPALARFKHRADEMLEQELRDKLDVAVRADLYMPSFFHNVFSLFRVIELNVMLNQALKQFKGQCNSVSFGIFGNRLRYSLLDTKGLVLITDEVRAPNESGQVVSNAVRAACARHGVACTAQMVP